MSAEKTDQDRITLVTAFFPIGRDSWAQSSRSDDKYFSYFDHWAGLKNDLIVFCPKNYASRIKSIRIKHGRINTQIITINDYKSLIPRRWESFKSAALHYNHYSLFPNLPETRIPEYDYVMSLKSWCINKAAPLAAHSQIAWIDFGFDHGGQFYHDASKLKVEWQFRSPKNVTLFAVNPLDSSPIFEVVKRTDTYIQGDIVLIRKNYAHTFFTQVQEEYAHLLACGLLDDDQTTLLMCARDFPESYAVLPSRWFSEIHDYRTGLRTNNQPNCQNRNNMRSLRQKLSWLKTCLKFSLREMKNLYSKPPLE